MRLSVFNAFIFSLLFQSAGGGHMDGPSEVHTEIGNSTHFLKVLDLDQILIFLNSSIETIKQF